MGSEGHKSIIVFIVGSFKNTIVEKVSVDEQVVQVFAVAVIIIAKDVCFFIAVIKGGTGICFWVNTLSVTGCKRSVITKALVFFHADVNNSGVAGCVVLSRWVG